MSKAIEHAKKLEYAVSISELHAAVIAKEELANTAKELRRLAEIERKYNEIVAQEPVAWGRKDEQFPRLGKWSFTNSSGLFGHDVPVYTLPKD